MAKSQEGTSDLAQAKQDALAFHERELPDPAGLWRDGLNLYLRGFDPLKGHAGPRDEDAVKLGLLITAWQYLLGSFRLACWGYYPPALNLLRAPLEYGVAYWYLQARPGLYRRFIDPSAKTPRFKHMADALARVHGECVIRPIRDWVDQLSDFSHADRYVMRMMIERNERFINYGLGPQTHKLYFRSCTSQGASIIALLLSYLNDLRQIMGHAPVTGGTEYIDRVTEWSGAQVPPWERQGAG
jgi:hypothetical protein